MSLVSQTPSTFVTLPVYTPETRAVSVLQRIQIALFAACPRATLRDAVSLIQQIQDEYVAGLIQQIQDKYGEQAELENIIQALVGHQLATQRSAKKAKVVA